MSKKSDDRKNIVIVGGGGYGAGLARALSAKLDASKYSLVLINPRPYYIHLVAAVRFTVTAEGKLENRAFIPYDKLFVNGNGTFVQNQVTAINYSSQGKGGELSLQDGETLHYDVLVLATGAIWGGPLHFPDSGNNVQASVDAWRRKYTTAHEIVFVGGGAVGIETAGEVRDAFPDKKITIIHAADQLLNDNYPLKFRRTITKKILDRNIDLILGDQLEAVPADGTIGITTQSGKHLPNADLVIPTFGSRPNTAIVATLGSDVLNQRGFVRVNPTLEVNNRPGVFALGDIIDWPEQKQLGKAPGHIAVVSANVLSFLAGQTPAKLYKSPPEIIVIPIGKDGGAAYADILWGIVLGNWVVRTLKGKDLFVSTYRKQFGLTA